MDLKTGTQEEIDKKIEEMLNGQSPYFAHGIMKQICPKDCRISLAEKSGEFVFEMTEWFSNPLGIVHGGMLVTLFDSFGGILTRFLTNLHQITTVNIQTTFLKPVQIGDEIYLKINSTSLGKTLISMNAVIYLPDRKTMAASATMTYYALKKTLDKRKQ